MLPDFEIKNLSVRYGFRGSPALDDLSFSILPRSFNVIIGQNGSGKSTLIRCLAGLQYWNKGEILRRGVSRKVDVNRFNDDQILISEDLSLPTVSLDVLRGIYQGIWPTFDERIFARIVGHGEIPLDRKTYQLSRGQLILAQFALGLATGSKIILVDEVTAALDPFIRRRVVEELVEHQKVHSATIVLATNIASEVSHLNANIVLLKNGKIDRQGEIAALRKNFAKVKIPTKQRSSIGREFVVISNSDEFSTYITERKNLKDSTKYEDDGSDRIGIEEIFVFLSDRGGK